MTGNLLIQPRPNAVGTDWYLFVGGDGYSFSKDIVIMDKDFYNAQAFVDYAEYIGILLEPPVEERSTQSFIPIPPSTVVGTFNGSGSGSTIAIDNAPDEATTNAQAQADPDATDSGDASKLATSILWVLFMIMGLVF